MNKFIRELHLKEDRLVIHHHHLSVKPTAEKDNARQLLQTSTCRGLSTASMDPRDVGGGDELSTRTNKLKRKKDFQKKDKELDKALKDTFPASDATAKY